MCSQRIISCSDCGGDTKPYDKVRRIVRLDFGRKEFVTISRRRCTSCGAIHRLLPSYVLPFKHYHRDIIENLITGQISIFDLGFEDYPCEGTIERWSRELPMVLWR